jgi:hypothetical protein
MRRFTPDEIRLFLEAVDRHLVAEVTLIIIGGSAAALAYSVTTGTTDVDTFESDLAAFDGPLTLARSETGLHILFQRAAIGDMPWYYDSRLIRELPGLQRLRVFVPERHDLVLSKVMRCHEGDLRCIDEIHRRYPLERDVLVDRFVTEMGHAVGHPERILANFLVCIERLFGEALADQVEIDVQRRRARPS